MVSRIEGGEDNMTIQTLRGIAAALGCSVVDILPDEDKRRACSRTVKNAGGTDDEQKEINPVAW
jgi:transcriptional regulator with XRE-family HTH domain